MSGYYGARLIRWREHAKDEPGCFPYIMVRRCQRTSGQLTAGDVLRKLYTWGDVPLLARRFDAAGLRERDEERDLESKMHELLRKEELAESLTAW